MRSAGSQTRLAALLGTCCLPLWIAACSAGGVREGERVESSAGGAPGFSPGSSGSTGFGATVNSPKPGNLGTEDTCDGLDENDNGIVDDVDKGRDGLCDCLRIGFLGEISGESGQATGSFQQWLESRSDVPIQLIGAGTPLDATTFAHLQVLVVGNLVSRTHASSPPYYSPDQVTAFNDWISGGGGVISLAGYTSQATAVAPLNELLLPTGVSYDLESFPGSGHWTQPNTNNGTSFVVTSFHPHPTTDGVTGIGVFHGYPLLGDGSRVASDGAHTVGMAKEVGAGHVFAWADEWITNDSEWTQREDLQVARFWLNTLRWLTPANECQVEIPNSVR